MNFKTIILIAIFFIGLPILAHESRLYEVIKVIDGDTVYIDFNGDGQIQSDEKVRLNGIDTFEVTPSTFLEWQMKNYGLSQEEALGLGYMGKEFAKKQLLGKYVIAKYTGQTQRCDMGRHLMSIYYPKINKYDIRTLIVS